MPRIKPPKTMPLPQRIEDDPITEPIEIKLVDDTVLEDIEINLSEPEGDDEPALQPKPKVAPKEEPVEDNPLAKALEAQKRAEELQLNAQRERDEALRHARERGEELQRERGDREDAQYNSVLTAIAAEQAAVDKSENDYAIAMAAQDWAAAAKAQRVMAQATTRLDRLEEGKQAFETKREKPVVKEQPRQAPQPQDFESRIAQLPEAARGWLRKHPEFINDPAKNGEIGASHNYLVNRKKVTAFSAAYFDALDEEFGFKQAPAAKTELQPTQRRSMPMSAPVSRDAPTPSGTRAKTDSIILTPEERAVARNSFSATNMTVAQKEQLYAQNKERYQRMKANGSYSEQKG